MIGSLKRAAVLGLVIALPACFEDSCFVRGTRVLTPRGPRRIEDLEVGDEVTSFDLSTRTFVTRRVARALRSRALETYRIQAGEHAILGVTAEHPFFDAAAGRFVRVVELTMTARLLATLGDGEARPLPLASITRASHGEEVEIFNLTIDGPESNYFAEGVLVHNKSEPVIDSDNDGYDSGLDCNDDDPAIHPDATEVCDDDLDNDCDNTVDSLDMDCAGTGGTGGTGGPMGGSGGAMGGSGGAMGGSGGAMGGSGGAMGGSGGGMSGGG